MNIIQTFPILYGDCQTGKTKVYNVYVTDNDDGSYSIMREHGQLDGKHQVDEKRISEGKNIGRANETSPLEQAISEAQSYWQKKRDANYSETQDSGGVKENLLPMLAQNYKDSGHRIVWPCRGQHKFNGVRCLARREGDTVNFFSRKGKSYNDTTKHLIPGLLACMKDGQIFDGELYYHGWSLQKIVSAVKKFRDTLTPMLRYYVYDLADTSMPFDARYAAYMGAIKDRMDIVAVDCDVLATYEEAEKFHNSYVQEGFEGLILRNCKGLYKMDHRSADLQKLKLGFEDAEFKILGGRTPTTGRLVDCCIFECDAGNGETFEVLPKGTLEVRKQYWKDLPKLIGKMLTVRFFGKSDSGVPLLPIGVTVRDYE